MGNGKDAYLEIFAFAFVVIFSASMFLVVPHAYPHPVAYRYALGFQDALNGVNSGEPFYVLSKFVYTAFGGANGGELNRAAFENTVIYLPVILGVFCTVLVYAAIRTRLPREMGIFGAVALACSSQFLINSVPGTYAPKVLGLAAFSASVVLFLTSDIVKSQILGIALAALSGAFLGLNMVSSESGVPLAVAMAASAGVQLLYYIKEKEYRGYAIRVLALLIFAGVFIPYAKPAGSPGFDLDTALRTYVVLLPLVALFAVVGIRDLIENTKKYELFFLAVALGAAGISLFDPVAAAPGMCLGAVFGVVALRAHLEEKWLFFLFTALVACSVLYLLSSAYVSLVNSLALSLLGGVLVSVLLLLYEDDGMRRLTAFAGVSLILALSLFSGAVVAQREYQELGKDLLDSFSWAKANLPEGAVVAAVGPSGMVDYLAERKGCNCSAPISRYLLGGGNTSELKAAGAQYMIVEFNYLSQLSQLASIGNVSRPGIDAYFFQGNYMDTQGNAYAYLASQSGTMSIPISSNGVPSGSDASVEGIGTVSYGRLRRFGGDGAFTSGSGVVLPLYGERNNLFDIYFETPSGLQLVYPAGNDTASGTRIYRIT